MERNSTADARARPPGTAGVWEVEHQHGRLGDLELLPYGNGVLLWFEFEEYEAAVQRAAAMNVEIVKPSHRSENLNWELWLRDPDGYMVVLTSPLPGLTQSGHQ